MIGACRLNNKSMRNIRRNEVYQCLAIDLAMLGVISKEECEMLIGSGIPKGLILPNGKQGELVSEENLPEQPAFIQTEDTETQETGDETPAADETQETEDKPDVQPEPIPGVTEMPGETETDAGELGIGPQEPVDDEGRTESDN